MKLYDEYEELHDKFQILAFHDTRAKDFEDLDEKLASVVKDRWNGRELPFPILMDATGKTIRDYGISAYPTVIIINPEGKLIKGGEHLLELKLKEMAEKKDGDK